MESNSEGATDRKEDVMSTNADAEHDEFLEGREEIPEATNENNENESQQLEEVEVKDDEGKEENIEMDVGTSADNEIVVVEDMKELANEADKAEEKEVEVVEEKEQTEVSEMEISETVEVAEVPPVNETENNTEGKQGDEVQEMENVEIGNLSSLADAAIEAQKVSMRLNDKALLNELESNYVAVRNERDSLRTANDHQVSQISSLQKSVQDLQAKLSEKEQQMGQAQSTAETEKIGGYMLNNKLKSTKKKSIVWQWKRIHCEMKFLNCQLKTPNSPVKSMNTKLLPSMHCRKLYLSDTKKNDCKNN